MAKVVHVQTGHEHAVSVGSLRVFVIEEKPNVWSALGLEIDYAASGESLEDVKARFADGLNRTIRLHLQKFGNVENLLRWAPPAEWKNLLDKRQFRLTMVDSYKLEQQ